MRFVYDEGTSAFDFYAYVGNDPTNGTDPSGEAVEYAGAQLEICLGVCVSIQVARAHDDTTGKDHTLVTVGGGVGVGVNGGVVGGTVGTPGDDTNIENAKGTSVTASASLPGSIAGGTVGATKGPDSKQIVEGSAGAGTGGASVTVNETVTLDDAVDAVSDFFGFGEKAKANAPNTSSGNQSAKPPTPKPAAKNACTTSNKKPC